MKEKFLVFDDVVSETYLRQFVDNIFDYNWKFSSNLTYGSAPESVNVQDFEYGFSAHLTEEQKYFALPFILQICDLSGIEVLNKNQIKRIVPRLQTMLRSDNQVNDIHVDMEQDHYVIIFYPHTIDGDTILYDQTTSDLSFSKFSVMSDEERKEAMKDFTILERISPKENRAVVFNGNRYHSSSSPTKGPRCIVNVNVINNEIKKEKTLNYT